MSYLKLKCTKFDFGWEGCLVLGSMVNKAKFDIFRGMSTAVLGDGSCCKTVSLSVIVDATSVKFSIHCQSSSVVVFTVQLKF